MILSAEVGGAFMTLATVEGLMHRVFRRRPCCLVAIACLVNVALACLPTAALAASADLRVMSFNVRVGSANDGADSWDNRKDLVVQTVERYNPDLLGLQEDLTYQGNYIRNGLTGYSKFSEGVNADGSGEQVSILYRTDRFTRVRSGTFWLSTTPNVPGSESWGAQFPRVTNWLELRDKQNANFTFILMNTHWEHASHGAEARLESATLTRQKITQIAPDTPVILTGDFNADQGGAAYRRMMGLDNFDNVRDFIDTYREIHPENSDTVGTAHGFDGTAGDGRIDWILHDDTFLTINANIDRVSYGGRYPSDHFPINAIIRAPTVPEPAAAVTIGVVGVALALRRRKTEATGR